MLACIYPKSILTRNGTRCIPHLNPCTLFKNISLYPTGTRIYSFGTRTRFVYENKDIFTTSYNYYPPCSHLSWVPSKLKPGEGDLRRIEGGSGGGAGDTGLGLFVAVRNGVTLLFRGFKIRETGSCLTSWAEPVFCSNLEHN